MEQIKSIVGINHIGYAVKDMKQAKKLFSSLGYNFSDEKPDGFTRVNEVCDMDEALLELQKIGFTMLGAPAESIPLEGTVCFLYSMYIGLIELINFSKNGKLAIKMLKNNIK